MPTVKITTESLLHCPDCNNTDFTCIGFGDYKRTSSGDYKTMMNYQCSKCKLVTKA